MRDAFGSTFTFKLVIIFIVFYVCFTAIIVSYARAFRVKNRAIDIAEQFQVLSISDINGKIESDRFISGMGRTVKSNDVITEKYCNAKDENTMLTNNGICISKRFSENNEKKYYYEITSYIVIKFPVLSNEVIIPIKSYTKSYEKYY